MIDAASQAHLRDLFRRESRSFLQYARESVPWASEADRPLAEQLLRLAAEGGEALGRLAVWMEDHDAAPPYLGAYPTSFANYNFIDVRKLIGPIAAARRRELTALEADLVALADEGARREVSELLDLGRRQLAELEAMEKTRPAASGT
jgi:hypothetical protein